MKRLWSQGHFIDAQRLRQKKRERRRQSKRRVAAQLFRKIERYDIDEPRRAPRELRLFQQPPFPTLRYCNWLRATLSIPNRTVLLDFRNVEEFTTDALLFVRAIIDSSARHTTVRGNLPLRSDVAAEFKASGFFEGIAVPPEDLPEPKGTILKKTGRRVSAELADNLIRFARKHSCIAPRHIDVCWRNLVELMTNTYNHATKRSAPQEQWFASVYCRNGTAYFNFVDLGIGILRSAPARRTARRVQKTDIVPLYGNSELLRDVFLGQVGSTTGKPGRGLGLPRMREDARNGGLLNLHVLTSNVIGTVSDLDFRVVRGESFEGTAFRWQARN